MTQLARWISIVAHPFVTMLVLAGAAGFSLGAWDGVAAAASMIALLIAVVGALMFYQVRTGRWQHADASRKQERPVLYILIFAALAVMIAFILLSGRNTYMVRGILGAMAITVIAGLLNRRIKLSLHMAFGAFAAFLLLLIGSIAGWILLMLLPAVAWSRLYLQRHTLAEVTAGAALGVAAGAGVQWL